MTYAIDTHASIKRLADAGVPDNQAEALVELMAQQREDVATKADIAALQSATKADIAALQSATKADIAALNDKITTLQSNMATKIDLAEVKADVAAINDKMATMATKIDLAEVKADIATLNDKIATINDQMATKADIAAINDKIAAINDKMATKTEIAEMKAQLLISMIALGGVMIAAIKLF